DRRRRGGGGRGGCDHLRGRQGVLLLRRLRRGRERAGTRTIASVLRGTVEGRQVGLGQPKARIGGGCRMSRWRILVLLGLFFTPFIFLIGVGCYHLWDRGWTFYAWWLMSLLFTASFLLVG